MSFLNNQQLNIWATGVTGCGFQHLKLRISEKRSHCFIPKGHLQNLLLRYPNIFKRCLFNFSKGGEWCSCNWYWLNGLSLTYHGPFWALASWHVLANIALRTSFVSGATGEAPGGRAGFLSMWAEQSHGTLCLDGFIPSLILCCFYLESLNFWTRPMFFIFHWDLHFILLMLTPGQESSVGTISGEV